MSILSAVSALSQHLCTRFSPRVRAVAVVGALAVGFAGLAAPASAQFRQEDFTLTLSGFAQNDVGFDGFAANLNASVGYLFTDQFEAGVRQDFQYDDRGATVRAFSTGFYVNYHFGDIGGELQPFVGASLGYNYGTGVTDTFFAGPEGGVKWFLNQNWFVLGAIEYQFFFRNARNVDEGFDDGVFNYRLGLGVLL